MLLGNNSNSNSNNPNSTTTTATIQTSKKQRTRRQSLKWLLLYFPVRYILCASIIAYFALSNIEVIKMIEFESISRMLHSLNIPSIYYHGRFSIGEIKNQIVPPVYTQLLFLIFFPTLAITSRINFEMRLKILLFGALSFLVFIVSQFLIMVTMFTLNIFSTPSFVQTSIFVVFASGSLMIELMLFSTLTLPKGSKIEPIIKRSYSKEYAFLTGTLMCSFLFMYFLLNFLKLDTDSPILAYALLNLNITTIMVLGYFIANIIYKFKSLRRLAIWDRYNSSYAATSAGLGKGRQRRQQHEQEQEPTMRFPCLAYPLIRRTNYASVSFLIAAYNEEKIITRCIESIDRASSKYMGKTEIIIVNDGSTDQTPSIIDKTMIKLKHCTCKVFSIPNSGKGFALRYGLERTVGDIIFRIDADSVIHEDAIGTVMDHFQDPQVGSVGGLIFPIEAKSIWQKTVSMMFIYYMAIIKKGQELYDSIIVQAGAYSVFRKSALVKVGGWVDDQFGEDGELTNRMARFGYKLELELRSVVYTDFPESLIGLMNQRARWSVAFYHSRGKNLELVKDIHKPRSIIFLINLISNGLGFAHSLAWAYIAASFLTHNFSLFEIGSYLAITKIAVIQAIIYLVEIIMLTYYLHKYEKINYIKYFPVLRVVGFILSALVKPQALEVMLSWSCKWKEYNKDAFKALRKEVRASLDPER
jgi:cellulose synthase/poly-beta-1,6-N-acetylglucosamine synthase-like glycosyltransferase